MNKIVTQHILVVAVTWQAAMLQAWYVPYLEHVNFRWLGISFNWTIVAIVT